MRRMEGLGDKEGERRVKVWEAEIAAVRAALPVPIMRIVQVVGGEVGIIVVVDGGLVVGARVGLGVGSPRVFSNVVVDGD